MEIVILLVIVGGIVYAYLNSGPSAPNSSNDGWNQPTPNHYKGTDGRMHLGNRPPGQRHVP